MSKSHAAGMGSSPTPAQLKELFAQIDTGRITKRRIQRLIGPCVSMCNENAAVRIMGDDIIFPDEIAHALGLKYDDQTYGMLSDSMPGLQQLRICKDKQMLVLPGPPGALDLVGIGNHASSRKIKVAGRRCGKKAVDISSSDDIFGGWYAVRKAELPGSLMTSWSQRTEYVIRNCGYIPTAAEVTWAILAYYLVQGEWLFPIHSVWTASESRNKGQFAVGASPGFGIVVEEMERNIGMSSHTGYTFAYRFHNLK